MFWNLVRYEFKNVNKWYLALYGAVLAISVLIGASISGISQTYTSYGNDPYYLLGFLILVFGGLSVTLWIATIFLIVRRFKGSVYDRQGYLTLTLPVSEHQIITAKLLGALIWSIISYYYLLTHPCSERFATPLSIYLSLSRLRLALCPLSSGRFNYLDFIYLPLYLNWSTI